MDGVRNVFMYADNIHGKSTGWSVQGAITILSRNLPPIVPALSVWSSTPLNISVSASDPNGVADLSQIWVMVASAAASGVQPQNACWVFADFTTGQLGLVNDAATADAGRIVAGSTLSVSNSQCTMKAGTMSDNSMNFTLSFTPAFAGSHNVYVLSMDRSGINSGWARASTINTN
jgi:hypothetical protein